MTSIVLKRRDARADDFTTPSRAFASSPVASRNSPSRSCPKAQRERTDVVRVDVDVIARAIVRSRRHEFNVISITAVFMVALASTLRRARGRQRQRRLGHIRDNLTH
jgi:hypothetical protein